MVSSGGFWVQGVRVWSLQRPFGHRVRDLGLSSGLLGRVRDFGLSSGFLGTGCETLASPAAFWARAGQGRTGPAGAGRSRPRPAEAGRIIANLIFFCSSARASQASHFRFRCLPGRPGWSNIALLLSMLSRPAGLVKHRTAVFDALRDGRASSTSHVCFLCRFRPRASSTSQFCFRCFPGR